MLPQLSYIVAQAGVDSMPPPMLPRLTKPFQAIGVDSKVNGSTTTPSSTSGSNLDHSLFTPSYYVRPGSSPSPSAPPPPPLLPIPSNTSSTLTSPSTDVVSTSSSSYVYPPSNKVPLLPSSVVGAETGRVASSGHATTPQWQPLQNSSNPHTVATKSSSHHDYPSYPPSLYQHHNHHHHHYHQRQPQQPQQHNQQPSSSSSSSVSASSGYSQQQPYTSSPNFVYPTYQSNDQWTHRVTAPFVEPSKSSPSPPPPSIKTYPPSSTTITTSSYLPYTNTIQTHVQQTTDSFSTLNSSTTAVEQHQPHLHHSQKPHKHQHEDQHQHQHQHQQQQQQRQSRGFTVPDNNTALSDDSNNIDFNLSYGTTAATTSYTTSHCVEHMNKWNQLLTRMDHEFWEQSQEVYQEKLSSLQQELKSLQNDTHVTFRESLSDLKIQRDAMIADAECFLNYQMEGMEQLYSEDIANIEDEYNNERKHLHNATMAVIEDRRKLIKEEKDNGLNAKDLFEEAYSRVTNKRTLRKRPAENSRHDSRKRQARHAAAHQLDGNTSSKKEDEDLEDELQMMKMLPQDL
ncbi:unnamed protein product [Absidia cylindrospora]